MKERRRLCAELLPSSRVNSVEDWIDEGSFPLYSLRNGTVAQSGLLSSGHPIVDDCGQLCADSSPLPCGNHAERA